MPSSESTFALRTAAFTLLVLCATVWAAAARAQVLLPDGFSHEVVVSGLTQPTAIGFLPDGRLLVTEQVTGRVRLIANGALVGTVGTVPNVNTAGHERGLLGIAVDPGWPARPYLYLHVTSSAAAAIVVSRFTASGDLAFSGDGRITFDPASRYDLLNDIPDVRTIHNGGTVRFGPDGRLYVSVGEDNERCAAQDTSSLRGVILRLDVSRLPAGPGGPPARDLITPPDNPFAGSSIPNRRIIWALGLRNPFRFHVDPADGALFIADVGLAEWEEVNRADRGGLDFGWPLWEGPDPFETCAQARVPYTPPIHAYDRGSTAAVIGAGVYRAPPGAAQPFPVEYEGDYFLSDYYAGFLRRLHRSGTGWPLADAVAGQPRGDRWGEGFGFVSDYAIGPDGSLWFCRQTGGDGGTGSIERVVAAEGVPRAQPVGASFGPPIPSPSAGGVQFEYTITAAARVSIALYDLSGRLVRRLIPGREESAGPHAEIWDGADDDGRLVRSGLYVARLEAGRARLARRVVIVR